MNYATSLYIVINLILRLTYWFVFLAHHNAVVDLKSRGNINS